MKEKYEDGELSRSKRRSIVSMRKITRDVYRKKMRRIIKKVIKKKRIEEENIREHLKIKKQMTMILFSKGQKKKKRDKSIIF